MTYRKKLIEVALPLEAINRASAREKSIRHGHPSTLHLWWARRPLAACRAVIFTSLVDDPDDPEAPAEFVEACRQLPRGANAAENDTPRQRLFDFIERLVLWESTSDEEVLGTARELIKLCTDGNPPPLLDPFAGGGSIPLEAQRLGLEAHASDLNPVAVMINKAMIEIPPKFADMPPVNPRDRKRLGGGGGWKGAAGLAADVRYYGEWMRDRAWERIGHLYPKCNDDTVIAWIWARTVPSPNPAARSKPVPLIKSFWLSRSKRKRVWIEPIIDQSTLTYRFEIRTGKGKPGKGNISRSGGVCLLTDTPIPFDYIRSQGKQGRMSSTLIAVVVEGKDGQAFHEADDDHAITAKKAKASWRPNVEMPHNPFSVRPPLYGFSTYDTVFTERQLVALSTFSELVQEAVERITYDIQSSGHSDARDNVPAPKPRHVFEYAQAIAAYLAFAVDRSANYWSSLTPWGGGFIVQTFGRQALPLVWDFAEANPFSNSTGNWTGAVQWIARCLEKSIPALGRGYAYQADATKELSLSGPVISTDPPYYDNVDYADLSDFFYIWLRHSIGELYPELFSTLLVPKSEELVATPYRFDGDRDSAREFFESGLKQAFKRMRHSQKGNHPITTFYAFKQKENDITGSRETSKASTGWETMLEGLVGAGLRITGTWPIRTERDQGLKSHMNVLASSIVLVCNPRHEDELKTSRREFVSALRAELPPALREMQSGNIAPVDLAQASIGPGMAVYSRYSEVLEPDGSRMTVRTALQLINHELDAYLAEQEGYIDADSRFAVAWFEQHGFRDGPFGQADVLARAKNTSVEGLAYAGVLASGAGRVRLLRWSELDPGWDPTSDKRLTTWEVTHHLIERLNTHGEEGAAMLLARMPTDLAAQARQLAYRLYSICERKGWAEQARDYNALVISWGASQEQAREFRQRYQQGRMFE